MNYYYLLQLVLTVYTCLPYGLCTPTLFIDISPSHAVVAPGASLQIHCIVDTTSKSNVLYKWYKASTTDDDDQAITESNSFQLFNNGTLKLSQFTETSEGEYYCIASNSLGSGRSPSTTLQVASISTVLSQPVKTINFKENDPLELACGLPDSLPEATVVWYKGTLVAELDSRIGVTLNGSLIFSYCEDNDIGPWKCKVFNDLVNSVATPNSYLLQSNSASEAIQYAQILYSPDDQAVVAGESLELQCIAVGRPSPVYTWFKNGNTVEQDSHISLTQESRILKIIDAKPDDAGVYTCRVDQEVINFSLMSEPVTIVVKEPPTILSPIMDSPVSHTQYASLSVSFNCTATGDEPISWTWLRNGETISESNKIQMETTNNTDDNGTVTSVSSVDIHSVELNDDGVWQCIATNEETGSDQITQVLTVNTSAPVITQQPVDILAFVGDNITIPFGCMAYPYPTFKWIENNEAIILESRHSVGNTDPFIGSLSIMSVLAEDDGVYKSLCSSNGNTLTSMAVIIKIIDEPVTVTEPQDTLVSIGSDTLVHCAIDHYSNNDIIIAYTWTSDFEDLPATDRITVYPNGTLLIRQFNVSDIGYYQCMVVLEFSGHSGNTLTYEIGGAFVTEDPPTRPGSPINLSLLSITSKMATISWDIPTSNGGLQILGYVVEVKNLGRSDCSFDEHFNVTTNSSVSTQLTVSLAPYTEYQLVMYSFNSLGYSNASDESVRFWTLEEVPSKPPMIMSAGQWENVGELAIIWVHPPCQERNGLILTYTIELTSTVPDDRSVTTMNNATSIVIKGLRALEEYTIRISASTVAGEGPYSMPFVTETTLASVPSFPRNLTIFHSSSLLHITWDPPMPRVNEPLNELTMVTHYVVRYSSMEFNISGTQHNVSSSMFDYGEMIEVKVWGINNFGRGESASVSLILPTPVPTPSPSLAAVTQTPSLTPTVSEPDRKAFYQEIWFPAFAGGVGGATILAAILICVMICAISYCCKKNSNKHDTSFDSNHRSGSTHSFTYPHRKSTVLDKMMHVEALDSPTPDPVNTEMETANDSGNGQDSGSVCTMTLSQSSSTLRSKYQYRSPMEQEEYQRLSEFRKNSIGSTKSDKGSRTKIKTDSGRKIKKHNNGSHSASSTPASMRMHKLTREASPTDTVSSFEYQSQSQVMGGVRLGGAGLGGVRPQRLPSYTTDGYDTSSEDDSVFHQVRHNERGRDPSLRKPVVRNSSFKLDYNSKNVPNLALMTALPQNGVDSPPYMPTAIPLTPQFPNPPPSLPISIPMEHPQNHTQREQPPVNHTQREHPPNHTQREQPSNFTQREQPPNHTQRLNRPIKSRPHSIDKPHLSHQTIVHNEKGTFV